MAKRSMANPHHHPKCPRCKGEGFYLAHEGQGYMRDGSFSHNRWDDCRCHPDMKEADLPRSLDPPPRYLIVHHPEKPDEWYWLILHTDKRGAFGRPQRIRTIGLDGVDG